MTRYGIRGGCHRYSEGCRNCHAFFLDKRYGRDTNEEHFTDQRIIDANAVYGAPSDQAELPEQTGLKKKIFDYYHENVYFTPGGILSKDQFKYMIKAFGADHIIWAMEYPYIQIRTVTRPISRKSSGYR